MIKSVEAEMGKPYVDRYGRVREDLIQGISFISPISPPMSYRILVFYFLVLVLVVIVISIL
jgi:hypothetical protein